MVFLVSIFDTSEIQFTWNLDGSKPDTNQKSDLAETPHNQNPIPPDQEWLENEIPVSLECHKRDQFCMEELFSGINSLVA